MRKTSLKEKFFQNNGKLHLKHKVIKFNFTKGKKIESRLAAKSSKGIGCMCEVTEGFQWRVFVNEMVLGLGSIQLKFHGVCHQTDFREKAQSVRLVR